MRTLRVLAMSEVPSPAQSATHHRKQATPACRAMPDPTEAYPPRRAARCRDLLPRNTVTGRDRP
jgi:hypothetical protein